MASEHPRDEHSKHLVLYLGHADAPILHVDGLSVHVSNRNVLFGILQNLPDEEGRGNRTVTAVRFALTHSEALQFAEIMDQVREHIENRREEGSESDGSTG